MRRACAFALVAIAGLVASGLTSPGIPGASASTSIDGVAYSKGTPFELTGTEGNYWTYVPEPYDESHATPTRVLVWLHGCGGYSAGDIWSVSPGGGQDWISVAPEGREGSCWDPASDQARVLAAIADLRKHFNVDPRSVILGGYSSGGDLAYRTAFYNAGSVAGILVANTSPFRDTGSSQSDSLAAASWKFNVVHLAHLQDDIYPIAGVRDETDAMVAAGFPLTRIEVDGTHWDAPGEIVNGHPVPGTDADIRTMLLSHIDDGWLSPLPVDPGPDPTPDPDPTPEPSTRPRVSVTAGPGKKTSSRKATFRFRSSVAGSAFRCRLDAGNFRKCSSPKRFGSLAKGHHSFRLMATAAGIPGPVTTYAWKIKRH